MADISKCMGRDCPKKEKCYRYTAKENPWRQSYLMETPYKDGKCEHFMEIWDEPVKKKSPKKPNKTSK